MKTLRPEVLAFAQQVQDHWDDLDKTPTEGARQFQVILSTLGGIEPALRRNDVREARDSAARFVAALIRG